MISSATYKNNIRIKLTRTWNENLPILDIMMYFPSTANAIENDTTINRIIMIATYNNYGGINVVNINTEYSIDNNYLLIAWGNKVSIKETRRFVGNLLKENKKLLCFKKLKNGNPALPTRLPEKTKIQEYF